MAEIGKCLATRIEVPDHIVLFTNVCIGKVRRDLQHQPQRFVGGLQAVGGAGGDHLDNLECDGIGQVGVKHGQGALGGERAVCFGNCRRRCRVVADQQDDRGIVAVLVRFQLKFGFAQQRRQKF